MLEVFLGEEKINVNLVSSYVDQICWKLDDCEYSWNSRENKGWDEREESFEKVIESVQYE